MTNKRNRREELIKKQSDPSQPASVKTPSSPEGRLGFSIRSASYSGPILPQQLEAYEKSEAGRLYVRAMIKQAEHRMEIETIVINGDNHRANRG